MWAGARGGGSRLGLGPAGPTAAAPCPGTPGLPAPLRLPRGLRARRRRCGAELCAGREAPPRGGRPGLPGRGRRGLGVGNGHPSAPSPWSLADAPHPPSIPVIVEFIYPPLRSGRPGRGGAGGLAGVGWGGGAVRSQVQPRPGKFPFRPELGVALVSGSPGPSARDPRGRGGRALGYFATLCQFLSIEGTPPLYPSPAPHPTPRRALPGLQTPAGSPGAPTGWGEGLLCSFGKVFQGFFLAY